jgi:hypothetical protein
MEQPENKSLGSRGFKIALLILLLIFGFMYARYEQRTQAERLEAVNQVPQPETIAVEPEVPTQEIPPGAMRINGENRFGCSDREYFDRLGKIGGQGDEAALADGIRMGFASGVCVPFKAGEPVYLEENQWGIIKVRRPGEQTGYWTFTEAAN